MIEVAAILSAVVQHWADFWIILALLGLASGRSSPPAMLWRR